jgi:hypothetical protein
MRVEEVMTGAAMTVIIRTTALLLVTQTQSQVPFQVPMEMAPVLTAAAAAT